MKRKMEDLEEQSELQGILFGEEHILDSPESMVLDFITDESDTSESDFAEEKPLPNNLTVDDVLNIYEDVSKVTEIERYLNLLYRPFTCFLNTRCRYNLRNLRLCLPGSIYEPEKHSALVTTHRRPPGCLKVYANGNIYCQAFTQRTALRVLFNFTAALAELGGYNPSIHQPKYNLVNATFTMPFRLDLQALNARHKLETVYIPDRHPFLTYIISSCNVQFAIFPVGHVYVMFCTGPYITRQAIAYIVRILYPFRASSQQNESDSESELSRGDINYKLLWEKVFQGDDDFSILWRASPH